MREILDVRDAVLGEYEIIFWVVMRLTFNFNEVVIHFLYILHIYLFIFGDFF